MKIKLKTSDPPIFPGSMLLLILLPPEVEHGLSMGCSFLQGTSTCCDGGPTWAAVWIYVLAWSSIGCRWTTCFIMVVQELQGNLCSQCLEHLFPILVCRAVSLTLSHSSLTAAAQQFLPFLKYVI